MRLPQRPPDWTEALTATGSDGLPDVFRAIMQPEMRQFIRQANDDYVHWDKLRHRPLPEGIDRIAAWAAVELSRAPQMQSLPISFHGNKTLRYWIPPQQQEWISAIDQGAAGYVSTYRRGFPDDNERYLFNSLMEEAIASSQLEGACTTREVAKEMLRTERQPKSNDERMILNNYKAILEIRDLKKEKLTPAMICHLQQVLTDDTLDKPEAAGRFRTEDEIVDVVDSRDGEVLHSPPPASTVAKRIEEVCAFANAKSTPFVHPVIKAIALHFAVGFIHPFVDGNGRTARALFYWYMLKSGYWLFEYLPISRLLVRAPAQYSRAYLYTETDRGDLTYFNHYNLRVVSRAIHELHAYLEDQQRKLAEAEALLDAFPELNYRQRTLVYHALKHLREQYTTKLHEGKYRVSNNTARADLVGLENAGLLVKRKDKSTKEWVYSAAPTLMKQLHLSSQPTQDAKSKKKLKPPPVAVTVVRESEESKKEPTKESTLFDFDQRPEAPGEGT